MNETIRKILEESLLAANEIDVRLGATTESYRQQMTVLYAAISYCLDLLIVHQGQASEPLTSLSEIGDWLHSIEL